MMAYLVLNSLINLNSSNQLARFSYFLSELTQTQKVPK